MFTGIISELGTISSVKKGKNKTIFCVKTKNILKNKKIGDSIAVNGVCVSIIKKESQKFYFEAIEETLNRTNLSVLKNKDSVNLESPLKFNQGLDGHIVQGHVDCMGIVESLKNNRLTIKFPKEIAMYLAFKGSITINGVSLTISDLKADTFSVDLIPLTLKSTNLGNLLQKDKVNLEIDIIARYLEALLNDKANEAKYEYLKERNLI